MEQRTREEGETQCQVADAIYIATRVAFDIKSQTIFHEYYLHGTHGEE